MSRHGQRRYAYQRKQYSKEIRGIGYGYVSKWCLNCTRRSRRMRFTQHSNLQCEINRSKSLVKILLDVGDSKEDMCQLLTMANAVIYYMVENKMYRVNRESLHNPYLIWEFE